MRARRSLSWRWRWWPRRRPAAEMQSCPPGFTAKVYVTGEGFDGSAWRPGHPVQLDARLRSDRHRSTLARNGRRYQGGEVEDIWPVFRVPLGGGRLGATAEARFLYGPPLPNPQVGAVRGAHELLVTTYDRDRSLGVLYRIVDGRAELVAGGTPRARRAAAPEAARRRGARSRRQPLRGRPPAQIAVVQLDPAGTPAQSPLALADSPAPHRQPRRTVLGLERRRRRGAVAARHRRDLERGPEGRHLALRGPIAYRHGRQPGRTPVRRRPPERALWSPWAATARGRTSRPFTEGDAPRAVMFAPVTEATRRAGIAGDLFVILIRRGTLTLNEIIRVSGPFDDVRPLAAARSPLRPTSSRGEQTSQAD